MPSKKTSFRVNAVLAFFALTALLTSTHAAAQGDKILHNFNVTGAGGAGSAGGLVFDSAGNLYGTTQGRGLYDGGTVFELSPPKTGIVWPEKVLHSMGSSSTDGSRSIAGVIFDAAGNLYGTASSGGLYGGGTVFELMPKAGGGWTEKTLHNFNLNGVDGNYPVASVIFDAAGNLYGTTYSGGSGGYGTVYSLIPTASGEWTENILYDFSGSDGANPQGNLVMDASGNLYGTTNYGGFSACNGGCGTLFRLTGLSTLTTLHAFSGGADGNSPHGGLVMDASGNLYGTTVWGGTVNSFCPTGCGVAFELSPGSGGTWTETVLHRFGAYPSDGYWPSSGLIFDSAGNLYGTAIEDAVYGGGTVFELSPAANGKWSERNLHHFGHNSDGSLPAGSLVLDSSGNLYGATVMGGTYGPGIVFAITP